MKFEAGFSQGKSGIQLNFKSVYIFMPFTIFYYAYFGYTLRI